MMKKSRFYFAFLLLTGISISALAMEPEFDPDSNELIVPGVRVKGALVYDVKLKLNDYEILSLSESRTCPAQNATNFSQITNGMTLEQVNSIIGCEGVLLETDFNDGLLKTKYLWKFDNVSDAASIVLAFEQNILIL